MKLSSHFFLLLLPFTHFYSLSQNLPVYVKVTNFFLCKLYQNYKNKGFFPFLKISPILSFLSFSYSGIGRGWKCVEAPTPTVDQGVVPPWRKILLIRVSTLFSYLLSSLSLFVQLLCKNNWSRVSRYLMSQPGLMSRNSALLGYHVDSPCFQPWQFLSSLSCIQGSLKVLISVNPYIENSQF